MILGEMIFDINNVVFASLSEVTVQMSTSAHAVQTSDSTNSIWFLHTKKDSSFGSPSLTVFEDPWQVAVTSPAMTKTEGQWQILSRDMTQFGRGQKLGFK